MQSRLTAIFIFLFFCAATCAQSAPLLDFFYDGDCSDCLVFRETAFADIRQTFPEVTVFEHDLRTDKGLQALLELQKTLGVTDVRPVAVVIDRRIYLGGQTEIARRLPECLAEFIGQTGDILPILPLTNDLSDAVGWDGKMGVVAVLLAGLADGLNPCAFATIVFLASLLLARGNRPAVWWACGVSFCSGVFTAYMILGFGILRLLIRLAAWRLLGDVLRWSMAVLLVILAALSWRDAWHYKKSGLPGQILLKLPDRLRDKARWLARWGAMSGPRVWLGMFAAGVLVTLLEVPCTGQIYAPVLFYLSRRPESGASVWGLLLLYNIMFVLPHALVFVLAAGCQGAIRQGAIRPGTGARLADWSRRNVVPAKVLIGLVMLLLAFLLLVKANW